MRRFIAGEVYEPPPDIVQAMRPIQETAAAAAAAAPAGEAGGTSGGAGAEEGSRSKKLPPQTLQAVRKLAPLFQRCMDGWHGPVCDSE